MMKIVWLVLIGSTVLVFTFPPLARLLTPVMLVCIFLMVVTGFFQLIKIFSKLSSKENTNGNKASR